MKPENSSSIMFFGFPIDETEQLPTIRTVGWESKTTADNYEYDCRVRRWDNDSPYIFQYTVSGEGAIEYDGRVHSLPPGHAFLIERPGPYRYFLPPNSHHWELKFLAMTHVEPYWQKTVQLTGRTIDLGLHSTVIEAWDEIYRLAESRAFRDTYHNSQWAYRFLMELRRFAVNDVDRAKDLGRLEGCLKWMSENFEKPVNLSELVDMTGLSQSYFMRMFVTCTGDSPMHYLTKIRVRHASQLLMRTKLPIESVARQCGFDNGNYFAKVFRKLVGVSPRDFRRHSGLQPNSRIHFL